MSKNKSSRQHNIIYSYEWGQNVVQAFTERYARGTENLCKIAGISHEHLSRYLILRVCSKNQLLWEAFKLMIKAFEKDNWREYSSIPEVRRREYLTYVKYLCEDIALDELISKEKALEVLDKQLDLYQS